MRLGFNFIALLFLSSCSSIGQDTKTISNNKWVTVLPHTGEAFAMKLKYKCQIFPMKLALLYLRQDSTYVLGYCDCQISEAGKYKRTENSILFYERYNFKTKANIPDLSMLLNGKYETLFFRYLLDSVDKTGSYDYGLIPLKCNYKGDHLGVLRNEEMPLDSLLINNTFWPYKEKQEKWLDSMIEVHNKGIIK